MMEDAGLKTVMRANPLAPAAYADNTASLACSLRAAIGKGWINPASKHEATRLYHALNAFLEVNDGHAEPADRDGPRQAHSGT